MRIDYSDTVSGEIQDDILVVTINNPPVNALSASVRLGLSVAIGHLAKEADLKAAIITGAGKTFIGGADITEFGKPIAEPFLPDLLLSIEDSEKPVVAAINGAALGGGLETAMACHGRVMAKDAKIGLPEVKLGLVPGAGGTQRLPRLVGVEKAIDIITSGRSLTAQDASELALAATTANVTLLQAATNIAKTLAVSGFVKTAALAILPADNSTLSPAIAKIKAKTRGQLAPLEAIRLVQMSATATFADGLAEERRTFLALRDSEQSKALRYVFFAERANTKIDGLDNVLPIPVETIGIIGLGLMGSGIVAACLSAGYRVIGVETSEQAALKGSERVAALIDRATASGRLTADAANQQKLNFSASHHMPNIISCDLVIEAVFDDIAVKTDLFAKLDEFVRPNAILATNTSYLNPDQLAAIVSHPERVIGLHFFSPANIMRLVEVIKCAKTAPQVLATGFAFAKKLGKLPILSGVTEGFIGNRMFSAMRREAEFLLEDGALPQQIDSTLEDFGYAMGPFAVFDLAGLDIAWARRKRQAESRNPSERYVAIADRLCEMGRFGQKTGAGWYSYHEGKKSVDPIVTALIETARVDKNLITADITPAIIFDRILKALKAEGDRLLEEKIATRASDIDLVMINGYGFPAYKGGPMFLGSST